MMQEKKARETYLKICDDHIKLRKRTEFKDLIIESIPYNTVPPRYCTNTVMIDHFKFINGLRRYLFNRVKTYREMKLDWSAELVLTLFFSILLQLSYFILYVCPRNRWRDSARFLHFIKLHKGICIDCEKSGCVNAKTGKAIEIVPNKVYIELTITLTLPLFL